MERNIFPAPSPRLRSCFIVLVKGRARVEVNIVFTIRLVISVAITVRYDWN